MADGCSRASSSVSSSVRVHQASNSTRSGERARAITAPVRVALRAAATSCLLVRTGVPRGVEERRSGQELHAARTPRVGTLYDARHYVTAAGADRGAELRGGATVPG